MNQDKIDSVFVVDEFKIAGFFNEYRWLSNFHDHKESPIVFRGYAFNNVEAYYQAHKTFFSTSPDKCPSIAAFSFCDGATAKKLSRQIVGLQGREWDNAKIDIMFTALRIKFSKEPLRAMLLETGRKKLIESNFWRDVFWGVCNGKGKNALGRLLMHVRDELSGECVYPTEYASLLEDHLSSMNKN